MLDSRIQVSGKPYRITGTIGKGAAGTVYLVKDNNGISYALKKIDNYRKNRMIKQMVDNQIRIQKIFQGSPYIIQCLAIEQIGNSICIILQLGQCSLRHWVQANRQFNQSELFKMICDVCEGLTSIHAKNIIHRDIKPQNIIKKNNLYKISDFGSSSNQQQNQLMAGTALYWPPQILLHQEERISNKVDVWSFGVSIFQAYFRINPFCPEKILGKLDTHKKLVSELLASISQLTPNFTIIKVINSLQPNYIRDKVKNLNINFIEIFTKIFQPNPDKRPTMSELNKYFQHNKSSIIQPNIPKTRIKPQYLDSIPQDIQFLCLTKNMVYQSNFYNNSKHYNNAILGLQLCILLLQNANYESTFYIDLDKKQQLKIYRNTTYEQAEIQIKTLLSQYYFYLLYDKQAQNYHKIKYLRLYILMCSVWMKIMEDHVNFCHIVSQIVEMEIEYPLRLLEYVQMFSSQNLRDIQEKLVLKYYI